MLSPWDKYDESRNFPAEESEMEKIMAAIKAIRNRRAEMNVPPSRKAQLFIETASEDTFRTGAVFMQKLASASEVTVGKDFSLETAVSIITEDARIYIPMAELIDFEAERARLNKELAAAEKQLSQIDAKLSNENFVNKAPANVVQGQRDAAEKLRDKIAMLKDSIASLG